MLDKLTIIIPTRNRHKFINNQIDYLKNWGTQIFLLDGSDEINSYLENLAKKIPNLNYIHNKKGIFARFEQMKGQIRTKYSMFMSDDEFFFKKSLEMCIKFLNNNPDYVSCSGVAVGFKKSSKSEVIYREVYPRLIGYSISAENPKDRVIDHMSKYVPCSVYGVLQSRIFNKFLNELDYTNTSCSATYECWMQNTTAYMGKIMVLPVLYWLRNLENSPVQDQNWNRKLTFYKWYNSKSYEKEKSEFVNNFCKLNYEKSTDFFKLALSNFSKDLNERKGEGTIKRALFLFFKRTLNFILRKLKLFKVINRINQKHFFNYNDLTNYLDKNKIKYDEQVIKQIEKQYLQM